MLGHRPGTVRCFVLSMNHCVGLARISQRDSEWRYSTCKALETSRSEPWHCPALLVCQASFLAFLETQRDRLRNGLTWHRASFKLRLLQVLDTLNKPASVADMDTNG